MKTSLLPALLGSGLLCADLFVLPSPSAHAALPLCEPFNYTPTGDNLTGKSPDGGVTAWKSMGAVGSDPIVINEEEGFTNRIPLGMTINTGAVDYSFARKVTDLGSPDTVGGCSTGDPEAIESPAAVDCG